MEWLLQRLKMLVAVVMPLIVAALMKGAEQVFQFDIPNEWEAWVLAFVAALMGGAGVERTPNLSGRQAKDVVKGS